jgi:hypothetical protein
VAGVINGSTLTYMSCDETTGRLKGAPGFLVQSALDFIGTAGRFGPGL